MTLLFEEEEKQWGLTGQRAQDTWGLGLFLLTTCCMTLDKQTFSFHTCFSHSLFFLIHLNWKLLGWGLAPNMCSNRS